MWSVLDVEVQTWNSKESFGNILIIKHAWVITIKFVSLRKFENDGFKRSDVKSLIDTCRFNPIYTPAGVLDL